MHQFDVEIETPLKYPKQIIILRKDLNMRKGKMVAQGAHASVKVVLEMEEPYSEAAQLWLGGSFTKVAVGVQTEDELLSLYQQAHDKGLPCALIQDEGRTEFGGVLTYTAVAIGPAFPEELDPITGHLKLL